MTERPVCQYVEAVENHGNSPGVVSNPEEYIKSETDAFARCTQWAVASYSDSDEVLHACEQHAPSDVLKELNIPLPESRDSDSLVRT